ncbi:MAG: glycoside hydrolase family 44 protein [Rudaea sp.]|nr:glycoside hydrolase family 44 protein [Rudaea sp.]
MRLTGILALFLLSLAAHAASTLILYDNSLENGFADGSWEGNPAGSYSLTATSPVYGTGGHSIQFVARSWNGLQFVANNTEFNLVDYQNVTFYVNGGGSGGQQLQMYVCDDYNALGSPYALGPLVAGGSIPKNAWAQVTLDFDAANLTTGTFNCLVIMDADGGNDTANGQAAVYIDQIVFNPRTTPPPPPPSGAAVNVSVDLTANVHSFSPLIFGVAYGNATRNQQMAYTVDRWGGNSTTRYNWQVDVHNTASDYYFQNIVDGSGNGLPNNSTADQFIAAAMTAGAQPLLTLPTIGYTPNAVRQKEWGFSIAKYGAQLGNECDQPGSASYCQADSGNGECDPAVNTTGHCTAHPGGNPAGYITGNDPADTSIAAPPSFEAQWIAHLQSTFGTAATGGVQLYTLDNEVMLWNSTHRDVHPAPATYDEIWGKAQTYAAAIKQQEPNALVTGPVTWGYCDLFSSAADSAAGNCIDGSDRAAHGELPFVAWYLQQVCASPLAGGKHLVDYLDLHYYPQGNDVALSDDDSPATAALRLRSLKELYDPTWVSESWIGQDLDDTTPYYYGAPDLIPRVKAWITQYCPGTKLAITEYNWGNDNTSSGAVAQAEALAIFAREGVDMATRWIAPASGTKVENAFSIFLNYDSAGAKVQGNSVSATSAAVDQIGAYAFNLAGQRTMVLLTNKDTVTHDVALSFDSIHTGPWTLYGFTGSSALAPTGTGSINGMSLTLPALPSISASLLVITDTDEIFKNGFEPGQ